MKLNLTLILLFAALLTSADDLYVVPFGTAPNFSSISDAVNAANDGDNILVLPGDYYGDVEINKTINLSPVSIGDTYNVFGVLKFTPIYANDVKESVITGAVLYNPTTLYNMETSTGSMNATFISCEFINYVNFTNDHDKFTAELFYNTFKSNVDLKSTSMIIGNTFSKDISTINNLSVNIRVSASSSSNSESLKIIANTFENSKLYFGGGSSNIAPFYDELIISNNNFYRYSQYMGGSDATIFFYNTNQNFDNVHLSVINNVIRAKANSDGSASVINVDRNFASISVLNNIFSTNFSSSESYFVRFNSTLVLFQNNILINAQNTSCPVAYTSSSMNYYFTGLPSSAEISNNQCFSYSEGLNNNYLMLDGTPSISFQTAVTDNGKNSIQYRDIDNTVNDIGIFGGPNTWANYHGNETDGTSRIIDLSVPNIIYPIGNTSIDIKGKAISTN